MDLDLEVLLRDFLAAYEAKDIAAIEQMFAPDVVVRDWNLEAAGRAAALEEFSGNFQAAETLRIEVKSVLVSESAAAAEVEIVVNEVEQLAVVDLVGFNAEGKIVYIRAYKGLA